MSYDIAMGLCAEVDDENVVVKLESAMLKRLLPQHPWQRNGTSLLRLRRSACSAVRVPQVGQEVYLDRTALASRSEGMLDLGGDGKLVAVDLRKLLDGLDPLPPAEPQPKNRASNFRTPHGR